MDIEIISESSSAEYLIRYNEEKYRVTVWRDGSKLIDWKIVCHEDPDTEITIDLDQEIMDALENL